MTSSEGKDIVERSLPTRGEMDFAELGRDVNDARMGKRVDWDFEGRFPGHDMVPEINFNSLNRIVSKYAAEITLLKQDVEDLKKGWMTIDSAPRDVPILCADNGPYAYVAEWQPHLRSWVGADNRCWMPTHWRHLPPPPTGDKDNG